LKKTKKTKKTKKRKRKEVDENGTEEVKNEGTEEVNTNESNNGVETIEEIDSKGKEAEENEMPLKKKRKVNERFRKIDTEKTIPLLNNYKTIYGDEGAKKVNKDLKNVKGDRFRHEKTKKKRSYKGGGTSITMEVHSTNIGSDSSDG